MFYCHGNASDDDGNDNGPLCLMSRSTCINGRYNIYKGKESFRSRARGTLTSYVSKYPITFLTTLGD